MSDKRNDNNKHDDINEFFAQFDQATVDQNRRKQSDSSSADAAGRSVRGNASRSGSRPGTRGRRNAGAASESSGKTRRKGGVTAAASRKKQGDSKKAKASGGKFAKSNPAAAEKALPAFQRKGNAGSFFSFFPTAEGAGGAERILHRFYVTKIVNFTCLL